MPKFKNWITKIIEYLRFFLQFIPKMLTKLRHTPTFILSILCLNYAIQQALGNGFPSIITRTLELRFNLSSDQSGLLNSSYEIAECFVAIFIIHFLHKLPRSKCIAIGFFVAGVGALIFVLLGLEGFSFKLIIDQIY